MGTLTKTQIAYAAGHSAAGLRDLDAHRFHDHVEKIQQANASAREDQQILDGARRAALDPEAPTRVKVLQPCTHRGAIAEVGAVIEVALSDAQAAASIGRCEIIS
jgi:hypothetical protein